MTDDRQSLPIPDYDHLSVEALQHQIRSLDESGLQALLGYERAHGDRVHVVQVLEARLDQLAAGAQPTAGSSGSPNDSAAGPPQFSPGRVSPSSAPSPPINPPSQGVPTNPAQPKR